MASEFGSVRISRKSNFGAHLGTAFVVLGVLGAGGGGYYFYTDDKGLLKHVTERDDFAVPAAFVYSHKGVPPEAVPYLRDGLTQGDDAFKKACARALGSRKNPDMTAFLGTAATSDPQPAVRAAMVDAMAANGDVNVGRYMDKLIDETDSRIRVAVCRMIAALNLERYIPYLINVVGLDHDGNAARAAKEALDFFLGDPERSFGFKPREWQRWYDGEYD